MSRIQIETTQNVTIEYEIASVGDRILAALLDSLIVFGYIIAMVLIVSLFDGFRNLNFGIAIGIIFYLPVFFYDLLCETFMDGQSFGKKVRKIKVVKMDGSQPTLLSYFLRWILRPIDILFTYGSVAIVTIFINGKGKRHGDLAANTTVIRIKSEASLNDTIFTEIRQDYEVKFPEVSALNDNDISVVKEVIDRVLIMSDHEAYTRVLLKTKDVISRKMGIESDMKPLTFLGVILQDYNYINNR